MEGTIFAVNCMCDVADVHSRVWVFAEVRTRDQRVEVGGELREATGGTWEASFYRLKLESSGMERWYEMVLHSGGREWEGLGRKSWAKTDRHLCSRSLPGRTCSSKMHLTSFSDLGVAPAPVHISDFQKKCVGLMNSVLEQDSVYKARAKAVAKGLQVCTCRAMEVGPNSPIPRWLLKNEGKRG